jgi:hypothetical protein
MSRARSLLFVSLAVLLVSAGIRLLAADKYAFVSGWRARDIRIDGSDEEWRPILEPVKGQHFSVAFLNDEDALYFCLVTADHNAIRQIGTMGLTLWLNAAAGAKKAFGVRYRGSSGPHVDVLGPGAKNVRVVDNGSGGIVARIDGGPDLLVYELRIPLRKTEATSWAPDVDAGAALRVQLETPEWRGPLPPLGRGGRTRVRVGVAGPNGGVFYPGPDTTMLKPIELAGSLRLASAPQAPAR